MKLKNRKALFLPLLVVAALTVPTVVAPATAAPKITVGFSYPIEANTYLKAIGTGAQKTLAKAGYGFYPLDAQLDGNKQISDIEAMITKKVDAMIVYPLDSKGLKPAMDKAKAAGIKVITMNYTVEDSKKAPASPSLAQVQDAFPQRSLAKAKVAYLNQVLPKGGNVLYVGLGFPVYALEAHANMFKEEISKDSKFTFLGRVDNQSDDAEGGRQAVEQALVRYPKVDAIVAYNDPSALGAYSAIAARGKIDIKIVGNQMQPEAVKSIRQGAVDGSWDFNPVESGISLAKLTISILKKEPKANWSKTIQTPANFYDASTISDFVPWATRLNRIK